ncbi:MAG: hypothetical protein ACC707_09475 [Thiohalomonadales bacterium]
MKNIKASKKGATTENVDLAKRRTGAAALAAAAAGIFYGLGKSDGGLISDAEAGEKFACWGINSCKGKTDCTTAFNACNGKNECKGKGFLNVASAEVCKEKGGVPLKGSKADPKKG